MFHTSSRQQYRDCVMGLGVSACPEMFVKMLHVSYPSIQICLFFTFAVYLSLSNFIYYYVYLYEIHCFRLQTCGHHGNDVICMYTKFDLHVCYRYQV